VQGEGNNAPAHVAPILLESAIQTVTSIFLSFHFTEVDAVEMGQILLAYSSNISIENFFRGPSHFKPHYSKKPCARD
jgi:hypothetical protein